MYRHGIHPVKRPGRAGGWGLARLALAWCAALLVLAGPVATLGVHPGDATQQPASVTAGAAQEYSPPESGCPPLRARAAFTCDFDEVLTRLFTPPRMPPGTYRIYQTTSSIETVVRAFRAAWGAGAPPESWVVGDANPLLTFGRVAPYDRGKVARLYGSAPARVARGPIVQAGRTVASITLVSPHPSPGLTRLDPGTLILDFRIPPLSEIPSSRPASRPSR